MTRNTLSFSETHNNIRPSKWDKVNKQSYESDKFSQLIMQVQRGQLTYIHFHYTWNRLNSKEKAKSFDFQSKCHTYLSNFKQLKNTYIIKVWHI